MLPDKMALRPMLDADAPKVLQLIQAHDEDDAQAAQASYEQSGLQDQCVLTDREVVVGVTGFRAAVGTERRAWLSWTYLRADLQGRGIGKAMLQALLEIMRGYDVRKLFVSTSDYIDPEDGPLYQKAIELYLNMGFEEELTIADYFSEGESQLLYGLTLGQITPIEIDPEQAVMTFNALTEIDETQGVYGIGWAAKTAGRFAFGKKKSQFSRQDCQIAIDQVKQWGGRAVLVAFPSNIPSIYAPLAQAEYQQLGRLEDYYQDGLHKVYFWYKL